jgi:undecaprenyl-diphosphatase
VARRERESLVLAGMLALGSVPAALAGYFLQDDIARLFGDPVVVSVMLLVTGSVLFSTRFVRPGARYRPNAAGSLLVGVSQAIALLPGISRSGFTISTGLFSGIRREEAARFSFLLSIPAIIGAAVLKLGESGSSDTGMSLMAAGFVVSGITGYIALRLLLRFLKAGKFSSFAWYCWILGISGISISLLGG